MEVYKVDITLEKIDTVVARTNVSYEEAKKALEENDGDVIEAIISIEKSRTTWSDNISEKGEEMINKVKEILRKGNVTKVTVKKDGDVIMNLPVTAAAIGSIMAAPVALLGLGSAILTNCTIEILKEDGEIININNLITKKEE